MERGILNTRLQLWSTLRLSVVWPVSLTTLGVPYPHLGIALGQLCESSLGDHSSAHISSWIRLLMYVSRAQSLVFWLFILIPNFTFHVLFMKIEKASSNIRLRNDKDDLYFVIYHPYYNKTYSNDDNWMM